MSDQAGFVLPIYADDGGTLAAMEGRINALVGSLDRAARKVKDVNDQLQQSGTKQTYAEWSRTRDSKAPNAAWTKARADVATATPATGDVKSSKYLEYQLAQLQKMNAEIRSIQNLGDVLRGITNEKVLKEQLLGAEQAFGKLQLAAAKAVNTMTLYGEKQIHLTRANLEAIAVAKQREAIEARMAAALARSTKSYQESAAAVMRQEAANQLKLVGLKTELELEAKLAKAKILGNPKSEGQLRDIAVQERLNMGLKTELELMAKLQKATAMNAPTNQNTQTLIAEQERYGVALRTRLDLLMQIAKAEAMLDPANRNSVEKLNTLQTQVSLQKQLNKAQEEASTGGQIMQRAIAVQQQSIAGLRVELDLEMRLAKARAMSLDDNQKRMRQISTAENSQKNILLKEELDLQERLAKARAAQDPQNALMRSITEGVERQNKATQVQTELQDKLAVATARNLKPNQDLIRQIADQERLLIPLKEEIDLQDKLAAARARETRRTDPNAKADTDALLQLNRAEMEHIELTKAINKLYLDQARAKAMLSPEYAAELARMQSLTDAERQKIAQDKLMVEWQNKVAQAQAKQSPEVQALIKQYNELTHQVTRATGANRAFSEQLAGTNQMAAGFRAALAGIGMGFGIYTGATIVAASATYSFVSAVRSIVESGAEFEKEMARVNAVMRLNSEQYQDLTKRANEMANSSRYAAGDVVKAYREMAMSGFTYQETVEGIHSVLKMASIGMMDFGRAADIATNVLYGFNLNATDLAHVVDVLANTVTRSAQDLDQLGTAMSYIAPIASSFGISLEMAAAATEVLANAGIKSSRAGTGLRRTFTALFSDSENVSTSLRELGVTVNTMAYDMDAELLRVLKELNKATNGATTGVGNLSKAVGIYATPAFLNLVKAAGEGKDSLEEILKAYEDVTGAASKMQARMEEGLKVDWEEALASLSRIQNEIFMIFGPTMREGVQIFTAWLRAFAENKDAIHGVLEEMKGLVKTVATLAALLAGGALFKSLGKLAVGAGAVVAGLRAAPAVAAGAGAAGAGAAGAGAAGAAAAGGLVAGRLTGAALASKALSVALRGAGWVGAILLVKDLVDALGVLGTVETKQVDIVDKLTTARKVLNDTLGEYLSKGRTVASLNAPMLEDLGQNQKALDEADAQVKGLTTQIENLIRLRNQARDAAGGKGQLGKADEDAYTRTLRDWVDQLNKALEAQKIAQQTLNKSKSSYLKGQIKGQEDLKVQIPVQLELKEEDLEKAQRDYVKAVSAAMADPKIANKWESMPRFTKARLGYDTFADFAKDSNPKIAAAAAEVDRLTKEIDALEKSLADAENDLKKHSAEMQNIAGAAENATDAQGKIAKEVTEYYDKTGSAIDTVERGIKNLTEANELEGKSVKDKIRIYTEQIAKFDALIARAKELRLTFKQNTTDMQTLASLSGDAQLEEARKQLIRDDASLANLTNPQDLAAFEERARARFDVLKNLFIEYQRTMGLIEKGIAYEGANPHLENLTNLDKLTKKTDGFADSVDSLRQSLYDLFNMDDSDLPDTLSGRFEKLMRQSEGLRVNIGKILSGEMVRDKSTSWGGGSGGGYAGGTGTGASAKSLQGIWDKYGDLIQKAAASNDIDPKFMVALISAESSGDPTLTSRAGAQGLMQFMPKTAAQYGVNDSFDPAQAIPGAARYIKHLKSLFGDDPAKLAAAYNTGETNFERFGRDVSKTYPETQNHAAKVLKRMAQLENLAKPEPAEKAAKPAAIEKVAKPAAAEKAAKPAADEVLMRKAQMNIEIMQGDIERLQKRLEGETDEPLKRSLQGGINNAKQWIAELQARPQSDPFPVIKEVRVVEKAAKASAPADVDEAGIRRAKANIELLQEGIKQRQKLLDVETDDVLKANLQSSIDWSQSQIDKLQAVADAAVKVEESTTSAAKQVDTVVDKATTKLGESELKDSTTNLQAQIDKLIAARDQLSANISLGDAAPEELAKWKDELAKYEEQITSFKGKLQEQLDLAAKDKKAVQEAASPAPDIQAKLTELIAARDLLSSQIAEVAPDQVATDKVTKWKEDLAGYQADIEKFNAQLEKLKADGKEQKDVKEAAKPAAPEVPKEIQQAATGTTAAVKQVTAAVNETTAAAANAGQATKDWSDGLKLSAEAQTDMVKKLQDEWDAANDRQINTSDFDRLVAEQKRMLEERAQLDVLLKDAQKQVDAGPITEEQKATFDALIEKSKQLREEYKAAKAMEQPMVEELIKRGEDFGKYLKLNADQLIALGEGYDSVWSRSRKYYLVMAQIKKLEDAGYLTKTEAALERISADLEKMDPLTKGFSENIVNSLFDVATGATDSKTAIEGLKQSLLDMVKQEYVLKIGTQMVGNMLEPVMKGLFEPLMVGFGQMAQGLVSGIGSMLMNSVGSMFGATSGAAGTGIGGQGGISNLFSASGLSNLFGGSSVGKGVADSLFKMGIGTTASGFGGGYDIMSPWLSGIANVPNWGLAGGGILGGILGNSLFGNKGYGGIGSSIGSSGGSLGGSAIAGMMGAGPVGLAVGAILGGLLGGVGGGFLGSLFGGDDEPRPGAYSAITTQGGMGMLEGGVGAKGGFGLTFGMSNVGSKNVDMEEYQATFDAFAKVTQSMSDFFGADVAKQIEESIKQATGENWSKDGIMRLSMDVDGAMKEIVNMIANHAAATGDEVALVFDAILGDVTGTAEEIANQVEKAMGATQGLLLATKQLKGTAIGDAFNLVGDSAENAKKLVDFALTMKEAGEATADAVIRVTTELGQLDFAMQKTQTSIAGMSQTQIGELAAVLADAFGGVEKLVTAQQAYYEQFTTATEKATDAIKLVMKQINEDFPKIKEKLLAINAPDKIKLEIPALKETLKQQTQGQNDALAEELRKLDPRNWNNLDPLNDALKDTLRGINPRNWDSTDPLGTPSDDLPMSLRHIVDKGYGKAPKDTGKDANDKALEQAKTNAKAALRASQMYIEGVNQGTITKSAETEAKLQAALNSYADEIMAFGIDVSKGLMSIQDQINKIGNIGFMSEADRLSLQRDPNADIYATLVNDMPKSREEFNKLIGQINLTTEAGRLLYAELMKLVPAFDAMYDSIEGFEKWLGVTDEKKLAQARLDKVFGDLGLAVPKTKEALKALYTAGKLTAEQMAILGANLEDLDTIFGAADTWDPYEDLTNATIAKLEASLQKFTEELNKSKAIVSAAQSAIESLHKISQNTESYQEEMRDRARAALKNQRLPDDINDIINGLAQINEQDYGSYEEFMAAVQENENLIRTIKGRAETQVSWDEKQVKLLQEQIDLAKEALLKERTEMQQYIKDLQTELKDAYEKLQKLWDTGIGATNIWLQLISDTRLLDIQTELQVQGDRAYALQDKGFTDLLAQMRAMAATTIPQPVVAPPSLPPGAVAHEPPAARDYGTATVATATEGDATLAELILEVQGLRKETRETQTNLVVYSRRAADMLYRWEGDGLPPDREDYLRQIAYNTRDNTTTLCE